MHARREGKPEALSRKKVYKWSEGPAVIRLSRSKITNWRSGNGAISVHLFRQARNNRPQEGKRLRKAGPDGRKRASCPASRPLPPTDMRKHPRWTSITKKPGGLPLRAFSFLRLLHPTSTVPAAPRPVGHSLQGHSVCCSGLSTSPQASLLPAECPNTRHGSCCRDWLSGLDAWQALPRWP